MLDEKYYVKKNIYYAKHYKILGHLLGHLKY